MSTFDGVVYEFPDILIDYFRFRAPRPPPRLCLLSHVHSDHLAGLESLRGPFVYCSPATREILLRLERYPCRINYANGTLEARKQTYKHLKHILKPIPLETPTKLELWRGKNVQVTLFDANHCVGAVMFLIEGDGKAVLYTGDIRSEPWWVNSIARNPSLVEYANNIKTLDRIYLDTSILDDYLLKTKAEGLRDLLTQVARYPADTVFFVQAWTYGYEDVWIALAKALDSKVHLAKEAPYLVGFSCANNQHDGCLTLDEHVRIHSCEKGTACSVVQNQPVVWVKPIFSRLPDGREIAEVGIGGGGGDLEREAELQYITADNLDAVTIMIRKLEGFPADTREAVITRILESLSSGRNASLNIDIDDFSNNKMEADLIKAVRSVVMHVSSSKEEGQQQQLQQQNSAVAQNGLRSDSKAAPSSPLPRTIVFPYARHSSYPELRHLVDTFRPKDVWPCTVHNDDWFSRGITLRGLFGQCCSEDIFEHDDIMEQRRAQVLVKPEAEAGNGHDRDTQVSDMSVDMPSQLRLNHTSSISSLEEDKAGPNPVATSRMVGSSSNGQDPIASESPEQPPAVFRRSHDQVGGDQRTRYQREAAGSQSLSFLFNAADEIRAAAFDTMRRNIAEADDWAPIELISTTAHHSVLDTDLATPPRGRYNLK
ncbi:artemis protein [Apiospora rasikravindrae]|uniref:Artemis protein n=1 Tax=Apiospora rasikravindrae TaxID=990691 RepID=A0ABR1TGA9_9PEZI